MGRNDGNYLNIIFDIDQTLIDSMSVPKIPGRKLKVPDRKDIFIIDYPDSYNLVFKRPGCDELLKYCMNHKNIRVGIWSLGTTGHVWNVMRGLLDRKDLNKLTVMVGRKYLDPTHPSRQYYTEMKTKTDFRPPLYQDRMSKPLTAFYGRKGSHLTSAVMNPSNTIIIDNSPYNTEVNSKNSILVPNYEMGKSRDTAFNVILEWLRKARIYDIQKFKKPEFDREGRSTDPGMEKIIAAADLRRSRGSLA